MRDEEEDDDRKLTAVKDDFLIGADEIEAGFDSFEGGLVVDDGVLPARERRLLVQETMRKPLESVRTS